MADKIVEITHRIKLFMGEKSRAEIYRTYINTDDGGTGEEKIADLTHIDLSVVFKVYEAVIHDFVEAMVRQNEDPLQSLLAGAAVVGVDELVGIMRGKKPSEPVGGGTKH